MGLRACMAWTNKYSNRKANCERQFIQEGDLCKRGRGVCKVFLTSPTLLRIYLPSPAQQHQCQEQSAGTPGPGPLSSFPHAPVSRTSEWPHLLHSTLPWAVLGGGEHYLRNWSRMGPLFIHFQDASHKFTAEWLRSLKSKLCDVALLISDVFVVCSLHLY